MTDIPIEDSQFPDDNWPGNADRPTDDPIAALVAEWRKHADRLYERRDDFGLGGSHAYTYAIHDLEAATRDTITLPVEDVRRLVRAAWALSRMGTLATRDEWVAQRDALAAPSLAGIVEEKP